MRRILRLSTFVALPLRALARAYDERNIRRLARRLGSSVAEAREVYRQARRDGFGAAYEAVLGSRRAQGEGSAEPSRESIEVK